MRNAECGSKNPKSKIHDPKSTSRETCLRCYCRKDVSRQSIAGRHGDFRMPCFSCRFGEGSRAFDLGLRNGEYGSIREPCREYLMKRLRKRIAWGLLAAVCLILFESGCRSGTTKDGSISGSAPEVA